MRIVSHLSFSGRALCLPNWTRRENLRMPIYIRDSQPIFFWCIWKRVGNAWGQYKLALFYLCIAGANVVLYFEHVKFSALVWAQGKAPIHSNHLVPLHWSLGTVTTFPSWGELDGEGSLILHTPFVFQLYSGVPLVFLRSFSVAPQWKNW